MIIYSEIINLNFLFVTSFHKRNQVGIAAIFAFSYVIQVSIILNDIPMRQVIVL